MEEEENSSDSKNTLDPVEVDDHVAERGDEYMYNVNWSKIEGAASVTHTMRRVF